MTVIFQQAARSYTPQTLSAPLVLGNGAAEIRLTVSRSDPSWSAAVGTVADLDLYDPSGELIGGATVPGGSYTLRGIPVTQSVFRLSGSFPPGTYSAKVVIAQTVVSAVTVETF
jgi:hypothetical protein